MKYDRIVLNIPHACTEGLRDAKWSNFDTLCLHELRWVDWRTDMLFAETDVDKVFPIVFPYSRFVCDVERLVDDPLEAQGQGIIYTRFGNITRTVTESERLFLMKQYFMHQENIINALTPNSLLIDCHSFPSDLSDIDICIGYNEDWSRPNDDTISLIIDAFKSKGYEVGINNPYSNSYSPKSPFKYPSVMIELNKRLYLNESDSTIKSPGFYEIKGIMDAIYNKLLNN